MVQSLDLHDMNKLGLCGGTPAQFFPAVVAYKGAQLDVFFRGADDHVWHSAQYGNAGSSRGKAWKA